MHQFEDASPSSLYRAPVGAAADYPSLQGQMEFDVAIVGGGLTGLSAALHLAEAGTRVAVLEAHQPAWGASGRNGGHINPGLKFLPEEIEAMFGTERGKRIVDTAWGGPNFLFSMVKRLGIDCDARQTGTLRAVSHGKAVDVLKVAADSWQRQYAGIKLLDAAGARAATGTDSYKAAMFDPRGGDVNPLKYSLGMAAAAVAAGASIFGDSLVESLQRTGAGWSLKTAKGSITAQRVLIATNGYTDQLWPNLRQSVIPVFSAIAATEPLPDSVAKTIMPGRSVLYESGNITVYYRVDAENRLLMGGRGPMKPIFSPKVLPNLTGYAQRLWPALQGVNWTHAWNGRVAMTTDHLPHFHNPAEGLFVFVGYNGRGVALSTALGPEFATLLRGGTAEDFVFPLSPIKPIAFHSFWPIGAKFVIAKGRVKDSLGI